MPSSLPFDDSRRLTGYNLYFADVGAVLETIGIEVDETLLGEWRARVQRLRVALGWPDAAVVSRVHASGASLAFAAPLDQLLTATEVNEWALLASLFPRRRDSHAGWIPDRPADADGEGSASAGTQSSDSGDTGVFHAPGHAAAWDEDAAVHTLRAFAHSERNPELLALAQAARARGLITLVDEDALSAGVGRGVRLWPSSALPHPAEVDWDGVHDAPIALVTGSNGKTTTTRLLAAFTRAHGWRTAYTCTDGVFLDGDTLAAGDYSGPGGARVALRAEGVDAAVLETARGGFLRRGLAVQHADVAVVTNVSADHFGEYGVHDLDDLARVKLGVAQALREGGTLVLNADDPCLVAHAGQLRGPLAWFALDADASLLEASRARGVATCGVRSGRLHLQQGSADHDVGAIAEMPLSFNGVAQYNVANIAAAVLAANALEIAPEVLRQILARFGSRRGDNPGRLQHWSVGGVSVYVDYAHNPDGLHGLLEVATQARPGRLGLLLGQAGNREEAEIRELAEVAARYRPERIVLKDLGDMLRGRDSGEVPAILRDELAARGLHAPGVIEHLDEYGAVRELLGWARPDDILVLPVHANEVKLEVDALLDTLQATGWTAGTPLPDARDS